MLNGIAENFRCHWNNEIIPAAPQPIQTLATAQMSRCQSHPILATQK
jgi:hypothetical protein